MKSASKSGEMKNRMKDLFVAMVMLFSLTLSTVVQAVPVFAATVEEYAKQCRSLGGSYNVQNGCTKTEPAKTITTSSTSDCSSQGGTVQNVSSNGTVVSCRIPAKRVEIDGPWKTTAPTDSGGQEYKGPDYNPNSDGSDSSSESSSGGDSESSNGSGNNAGYDSGHGVDHTDTLETSILNCTDSGNGEGIFCILNIALTVLTWGVGIAGTLGIVISGVQYLTARDSAEQMAKAKNRLVNIIIGFVVYAVAWGFLNWLIPGGLF